MKIKNWIQFNEYRIGIDPPEDRIKKQRSDYISNMEKLGIFETIRLIKKDCKEFLKNPKFITRGIQSDVEIFYSEPVKRYSIDNLNYYTTIIDNSNDWKKFPKRGNSFMCLLNKKSDFGDSTYLVVPKDKSIWGISPSYDIYDSFYFDGRSINQFFNLISHLYKHYFDKMLNDIDYNEFKNGIIKLQKEIKKNPKHIEEHVFETYFKDIINEYFLIDGNTFDKILKNMDPHKNGYKVQKYRYIEDDKNKEVWTESPCYFIHYHSYEIKDILNDLACEINDPKKLIEFNKKYIIN